MAKFQFPLEGVLEHRRRLEEQRQRELALVQAKMREAQEALRELDATLKASLADVRQNRLVGKLDLGFLAGYRRYTAAVQRKGTQIAQKMVLIQRELDAARAALLEAAKQRKIVEKLREKQLERWKAEADRKQAADLDEVSMRMAAWQMAELAADDERGLS